MGGPRRRGGGPWWRRCRCVACRRSGLARRRPGSRTAPRGSRRGRTPSRSATPSSARARMASGSRQCGQRVGHVASDDEGQVVLRACVMQPLEGIDRERGPGNVGVDPRDAEALVAGHRRLAERHAVLDARVVRDASLWGGVCTGTSSTRSSPSCAHASCAQTRWPTWGGLNVPPSSPTRTQRRYGRIWPSPSTRYLKVHSSRGPIGPRACSFWVELPISAPIPNSPPSVKRVEALT